MSVPSPVKEGILSQRLGALGSAGDWAPKALPELERFVRTADDYDLFRVNPIQYGHTVDLPEADAIDLFVHAAKAACSRWTGCSSVHIAHRSPGAFANCDLAQVGGWLSGVTRENLSLWAEVRFHRRLLCGPKLQIERLRHCILRPAHTWLVVLVGLDWAATPIWLSRKLDDSLERCPDRGSQPTVHAAGKAGVAAQEKAAPFFLALDAGAALDDGP